MLFLNHCQIIVKSLLNYNEFYKVSGCPRCLKIRLGATDGLFLEWQEYQS